MINFKEIIGEKIAKSAELELSDVINFLEVPPNIDMGDYAFPCFKLAKTLRKSPQIIASELKDKIELNDKIEKVDIVGGYLNFFVNKKLLTKTVLEEIEEKQENYGSNNFGNGKNVIVEYSSPNIAKPFHIGHLRNTVIGATLYNIYKYLGYNVIGINHLGDYGTQFGKMVEGYKRWANEYNFTTDAIQDCMDMYIRINNLCKEDETVLEACRENFKKIEDGDPYCLEIWNKLKSLSLKEFEKIYDMLGIKFDSLNGEAFYSDKMDEVVKILEKSGALKNSQGAKIVDLEDKGLGVCMIKKSNDSTTYATRDLAAILYRSRTYDFDKCLYVVASEQNLHFKQIFEVAKYLGIPKKSLNGLEHLSYGMVRLSTGKMSTREGTVIKVDKLFEEAFERVKKIIEEKNTNFENKEEEIKKIALGAIVFNNISTAIVKDQVFDWDIALNFNGETGPYIQYIYVRTKSVLEKAGYIPNIEDVDFNFLQDKESQKVISILYNFENILMTIIEKNEPSILARYLIELSQAYSNFYNENKIIDENKKVQDARLFLSKSVGIVLETGCKLLGIQMPNRM